MFNIDGKCNIIDVKDVYYVPSMRHNLLSVSNITDQNISIEYYKDKAKIVSQAGDLIAMAYKKNRLYELSCYTDVRQNVKPRTYVSTMNMPKQEKWHRMLGHTSFSNLK